LILYLNKAICYFIPALRYYIFHGINKGDILWGKKGGEGGGGGGKGEEMAHMTK
jgi:hypothetical protein